MTVRAMVPVETIRPGDTLYLRHVGGRVVSEVTEGWPGAWIVFYFSSEETAYENRARAAKGPSSKDRLVEKMLRWHPPGTLLEVDRGSPATAKRLHKELERRISEDLARSQSRQRSQP